MTAPGASLESRMGPAPTEAPAASNATAPTAGSNITVQGATPAPTDAAPDEPSDLVESNYEVAVKLVNMQGDPNSPLYSVKRFEDLGM